MGHEATTTFVNNVPPQVCIVGLLYRLVREHEIICVCFCKYTYEIDVLPTYLGINKYYGYDVAGQM